MKIYYKKLNALLGLGIEGIRRNLLLKNTCMEGSHKETSQSECEKGCSLISMDSSNSISPIGGF